MTLVMFLATQGVANGEISLGDLVLLNAFLLQLFIPLNFLGIVYRQIKYTLADMQRLFDLMQLTPDVSDRPHAADLDVRQGVIEFRNVDFHYQEQRPILHNVSFTVADGNKVAVVGHSGAGKSTLARLLFRFYDVTGGSILIDGQDIRDVSQRSLRSAIGIVPQDTVLFNESIFYNIAYGRPGATREEIMEILSVTVLMGGGPSLMYAAHVMESVEEALASAEN